LKGNGTIIFIAVVVGFVIGAIFANPVVEAANSQGQPFQELQEAIDVIATEILALELVSHDPLTVTDIEGFGFVTGPHTTDASELTLGTLPAARIGSDSITAAELAIDSVGGSEIVGTSKLIFGSCNVSVPLLSAGASHFFTCTQAGVSVGDKVVASMGGPFIGHTITIARISSTGSVDFALVNARSLQNFPGTQTVHYIVFRP